MSNVYHFMTLRMQKTRKRKIVKEHKYPHNRYAVDELHNLRYEYVIRAITAVSGYKDGNEVVKLIEKIKFAKPRR
mgnify:CR=1 FL=1